MGSVHAGRVRRGFKGIMRPTSVRLLQVVVCVGAMWLGAGCAGGPAVQPVQRESHGLVVFLPGVENYAWTSVRLQRGLTDAGLDWPVEVHQWGTRPFGTFPNLTRYALNREKAGRIANMLLERRATDPDCPIVLVGYSGGGAMAVFVAEALPDEPVLERMILIAPALSPTYDVSPALRRSRRGMLVYYSDRDAFMLGWATRTFGTMDRVYTDAAGRRGFRDGRGELLQLDHLVQAPWRKEWGRLWHDGTHDGWLSRAWAREVLAPEIDPALTHVGG